LPSADQDARRGEGAAAKGAGGPQGAAKKLVDIVDPQEDGEAGERPLLERLLGASQKVVKFLAEAPIACVSHALSFVKSFWPESRLEAFAQGVAAECSEEQFNEYLQEAQPVAEQIVKSVLQEVYCRIEM
jgi:hypothetical protein